MGAGWGKGGIGRRGVEGGRDRGEQEQKQRRGNKLFRSISLQTTHHLQFPCSTWW